jgi:transcriptional regulator with XRE-family HTH domain
MASSRSPEAQRWKREFGARLRELRRARGISQIALAHAAEIDPTYLSAVEQGRRNVSLVNIRALAKALDVAPGTLFM